MDPLTPPHVLGFTNVVEDITGSAFTTTVVVAAVEVQLLTVTVTLYVPALVVCALLIEGFWSAELNDGPVHEYVPPETVEADRLMVVP